MCGDVDNGDGNDSDNGDDGDVQTHMYAET
jgi:hypothetical protein